MSYPAASVLEAYDRASNGQNVFVTMTKVATSTGERLRDWMGIDQATFYDASRVAILPMGLCYPGRGKSGDLPPRPECAATWRARLTATLVNVKLTLVIGQYALDWHIGERQKDALTETVRAWRDYRPTHLSLPHPSPRNNIWLKRNGGSRSMCCRACVCAWANLSVSHNDRGAHRACIITPPRPALMPKFAGCMVIVIS